MFSAPPVKYLPVRLWMRPFYNSVWECRQGPTRGDWKNTSSTPQQYIWIEIILSSGAAVTLAWPLHVSMAGQSREKGKTKQATLISDFHAHGSESSLWPIRLAQINIDDVTIHPSRGSIPHWRCHNRVAHASVGYTNFRPKIFAAGKRISIEILVGVRLHAWCPVALKRFVAFQKA